MRTVAADADAAAWRCTISTTSAARIAGDGVSPARSLPTSASTTVGAPARAGTTTIAASSTARCAARARTAFEMKRTPESLRRVIASTVSRTVR